MRLSLWLDRSRLTGRSNEGQPKSRLRLRPARYTAQWERENEIGKTRARGVRDLLREVYIAGSGERRSQRAGCTAIADDATFRGAERAGWQFSVRGGEVDGKGGAWAPGGFRTNFHLPGIADCAGRPNSDGGIRARRVCDERRV